MFCFTARPVVIIDCRDFPRTDHLFLRPNVLVVRRSFFSGRRVSVRSYSRAGNIQIDLISSRITGKAHLLRCVQAPIPRGSLHALVVVAVVPRRASVFGRISSYFRLFAADSWAFR